MRFSLFRALLALVLSAGCLQAVTAQNDESRRLDQLTNRITQLESRPPTKTIIEEHQSTGGVLFLFGVVCALSAQNTNCNPWLWFFLGMIFSIITRLVLLAKNSEHRRTHCDGPPS